MWNHEEHLIIEMWLNYNNLLNAGIRILLWQYRNFILAFIFLRTFDAITSPLNLWFRTKVLCCVVLLNGITARDILISFNPNKARLFEGNFSEDGGSIYPPSPPLHISRRTYLVYKNFIESLNNLFKVCWKWKNESFFIIWRH